MKKYVFLLTSLIVAIGISFSFGSCRKKKETTAIITVRDTGNFLVPFARVILFGTSTETPIKPVTRRDTAFTDSVGTAFFNFDEVYQLGQAGVAVLDIAVSKGNMTGKGMIKIEEEQTNKATVFIQP